MNIPITDHLGNEFESIKSLAKHYNLPDYVVAARLKKGWSIEAAVTTPKRDTIKPYIDRNNVVDHEGNSFKSQKEMCEFWKVDRASFGKRLEAGWTIERALTTPTKRYKKTHFDKDDICDHKGNKFNSQKEMCEFWGIDKDAFSKRLDSGWTLEDALTKPKGYNPSQIEKNKCYDHLGNQYDSLSQMAAAYSIPLPTLSTRIKKGWSIEDALTKPKGFNPSRAEEAGCYDHLGNEYNTLSEMAKAYNILPSTLQRRLSKGVPLEDALKESDRTISRNSVKIKICDHQGNEYNSLSEMAKAYNVPISTLQRRLGKGVPVEDALKKSNRTRSTNAIDMFYVDHEGNRFSTKEEMCDYWGVSKKTFASRIKEGFSLEKALTYRRNIIKDPLGNEFSSIKDMCEYWGCSYTIFSQVRKSAPTLMDALKEAAKRTEEKRNGNGIRHGRECIDHLGNTFSSITAMCKYWKVNNGLFQDRIERGWSVEDALTKGKVHTHTKTVNCKDHLGNTFPDVKSLCDYYGVSKLAYISRIQRGMPLEMALTKPTQQKHGRDDNYVDHVGNEFDTLQEMLDYWNVERGTYFARLQRGLSLEETLSGKIFSRLTRNMEYGGFSKISFAYEADDIQYFECHKQDGYIDFLTKAEIMSSKALR
ncbi:MAG: hypothetical protein K6A97_06390 [Lachnospiraceae bacterium]|nr:hypothetical protein [Lachnospiraceae bacterium]